MIKEDAALLGHWCLVPGAPGLVIGAWSLVILDRASASLAPSCGLCTTLYTIIRNTPTHSSVSATLKIHGNTSWCFHCQNEPSGSVRTIHPGHFQPGNAWIMSRTYP